MHKGYGVTNMIEKGGRLIEFCKRRLYRWRSPARKDGQIVGNQTDYELITQKLNHADKNKPKYRDKVKL